MARKFEETLILEVLEAASVRLAAGWTWGHQARTLEGDPVPPEHPHAVAFCIFGALRAEGLSRFPDERCEGLLLAEASAKYVGAVLKFLGHPVRMQSAPHTLMEWNDQPERSQGEVVDVFRQTVQSLARRVAAQEAAA
jgi:hypothetical protein